MKNMEGQISVNPWHQVQPPCATQVTPAFLASSFQASKLPPSYSNLGWFEQLSSIDLATDKTLMLYWQ